jgi:DNA mismatch endonuclease, patch repair protein
MTDTFDREKRSWIMARVLSKGTKPELAVSEAFRASGLRFQINAKGVIGNPDFAFQKLKLAVFVNGCFWHWHGCARCRMPRNNQEYWRAKISRNVERDKKYRRQLRALGWRYTTIWECDLAQGIARTMRRVRELGSLHS